MPAVEAHVTSLARRCRRRLTAIDGLSIFGPSDEHSVTSSVTFEFPGMGAHALALLPSNRYGIVVRSGFHSSEPLHEALAIPEIVRASFDVYNTYDEVEALGHALE
jgi:cysteine desulfurase/selenocysteine lyase